MQPFQPLASTGSLLRHQFLGTWGTGRSLYIPWTPAQAPLPDSSWALCSISSPREVHWFISQSAWACSPTYSFVGRPLKQKRINFSCLNQIHEKWDSKEHSPEFFPHLAPAGRHSSCPNIPTFSVNAQGSFTATLVHVLFHICCRAGVPMLGVIPQHWYMAWQYQWHTCTFESWKSPKRHKCGQSLVFAPF